MPILSTVSTITGFLNTFIQNQNIKANKQEIEKLKLKLDLNILHLNDNELNFINIFINEARNKNTTLNSIYFYGNELQKKLNLNDSNFEELLSGMESYHILDKDLVLSKYRYFLSYSVFSNTNYYEKTSDNSTYGFYDLVYTFIEYIINNIKDDKSIDTEKIIAELFNNSYELFNPIMYYFEQMNIIKLSTNLGKNKPYLLSYSFELNNPNLKEYIRKNNIVIENNK